MTTIDPMVPDGFGTKAGTQEPRPRRLFLLIVTIVIAVLAIAYLVANHFTSKYYAIAPGAAQPVQPFLSVPANKLHKHKGRILLVTVSLLNVKPLSWISDKLNSNIQLVKTVELTGNTPPSQLNALDAVEMQTSTQTAVIVALERLGYTINLNGQGAEVDAVVANSPAANILEPGDVIVSFAGTPITSDSDLVAAILKHQPGDRVQMSVQEMSPARMVTKTVVLGSAPPDSTTPTTHAFLGIATTTKEQPNLPLNVTIDPGNIGGPSAGLSFTLGIIDDFSTTDITGGKTIAVTGTINPDGTVGDVGGVAQKAVAVTRAGAVAFLVPGVELKTAEAHVGPHVKVIAVNTLEQALQTLRTLGGNLSGLPPAPAQLAG